jgi:hypothetical protein
LELKKQLAKRGFKIPMKDQAYILHDVNYDAEFDILMQHVLMQKFKATGLSVDTKQTKLGL